MSLRLRAAKRGSRFKKPDAMRRLLSVLVLITALAAPAAAQSLEARLDLARRVAQVKLALAQDQELAPFDVDAVLRGDVVALTGQVRTPQQKERAAEIARGVDGIRAVANEVVVTPGAGMTLKDVPAPIEEEPATVVQEQTAAPEAEVAPEPAPAPQPEPVYHTVRRGDTLIAIARRYGTSVREIQRLNNLRGSGIRAGQRLRVK